MVQRSTSSQVNTRFSQNVAGVIFPYPQKCRTKHNFKSVRHVAKRGRPWALAGLMRPYEPRAAHLLHIVVQCVPPTPDHFVDTCSSVSESQQSLPYFPPIPLFLEAVGSFSGKVQILDKARRDVVIIGMHGT